MAKPKVTNTIAKCQCGGCREYFNGNFAFEEHRVGKPDARRCLTPYEMLVVGLATEEKNVRLYSEGIEYFEKHDVWYSPIARERVRQAFSKPSEDEELEEVE